MSDDSHTSPDGVPQDAPQSRSFHVQAAAPSVGPDEDPSRTLTVPGYTVARRIGVGGMGVVFEAEQSNPRRRVALKVALGNVLVDDFRSRVLQREAQILGRLKHPGIASIYDAGLTGSGEHYFAMELVAGISLRRFLQSQPIPTSTRRRRNCVRLFLEICDAIAYAHQRGVIHRDLKPSNIQVLLDDEEGSTTSSKDVPRIKVLDFGLGRMIDQDANMVSLQTQVGKIQGTLPYMSPEQARGDTDLVDVRSDVYSLGVILYEMLTGQRPHHTAGQSFHETLRAVCEDAPARPSTISASLRGDLETILLTAIDKDPARRYQSVMELANDVRRYLDNQPLLARAPSLGYQLRKLIERHRWPFAFASSLVIFLAAFAVTMSALYASQRQARARAQTEAARADRVISFLDQALSAADPESPGHVTTVEEVLDKASIEVESDLAGQPEVQATVQSIIGRTYRSLARYERAEHHLEAALASLRQQHDSDHVDIALTLRHLGMLMEETSRYAEAEAYLREALDMRRRLHGPLHTEVVTDLHNLELVLERLGRVEEGKKLAEEALEIVRRQVPPDPVELGRCLVYMAGIRLHDGDLAAAEDLMRDALSVERSASNEDNLTVANRLNNIAVILHRQGRFQEAVPLYRECLEINERLRPEHPMLGHYMANLGRCHELMGEAAAAESLYVTAMKLQKRLLGEKDIQIAFRHMNLASIHQDRAEYPDAERSLSDAERIVLEVVGDQHPRFTDILQTRADLYRVWGRTSESEVMFRDALARRTAELGPDHPDVALIMFGLSKLLIEDGRAAEAASLLKGCLTIWQTKLPEEHWQRVLAECTLGACLAAEKEIAAAREILRTHDDRLRSGSDLPRSARRETLRLLLASFAAGNDPESARVYDVALSEKR